MKSIATKIAFLFLGLYASVLAIAQDTKKVDVNIGVDKGNNNWYTQPWVWVVGIAVFILIIVALTRNNGRRD
jgi:hypothetical protein